MEVANFGTAKDGSGTMNIRRSKRARVIKEAAKVRSYELQEIRPDDVAGVYLNGPMDVSWICGLVVRDPEHPRMPQFQGCFQALTCPPGPHAI
jgi:hypothetical protein